MIMSNSKLLIVEDEVLEIETWRRQIDRNNAKKGRFDQADYASSIDEVKKLVAISKYDAAIVDIRLDNAQGVQEPNASGNEVRDFLLNSEIVLIAHLTGEKNAVDMVHGNYVELVRIFEKDGGDDVEKPVHEEILEWLEGKSDIVETMRAVKSKIASKMAGLFYSSIWPRWDSWQAVNEDDSDFVPSSITRHITSHLYSSFLEDSGGKVHPEEWYFQPPSFERFHTGDLIKQGDNYFILVTPRCDLERLKDTDTLLFAKMNPINDWVDIKRALDDKVAGYRAGFDAAQNQVQKDALQKKINKALDRFRKDYYGHKNGAPGFHFLPQINQSNDSFHGPFFVDFSYIKPVVFGSLEGEKMKADKIAAMSPEFVPALVQRLGTFISRIGSPDYSHFS